MSLTYRFKRDDDELWLACFLAALSGAGASDAMRTADLAVLQIRQRRAAGPVRPLFEPLVQEKAAERKADEDDSSFAMGRL